MHRKYFGYSSALKTLWVAHSRKILFVDEMPLLASGPGCPAQEQSISRNYKINFSTLMFTMSLKTLWVAHSWKIPFVDEMLLLASVPGHILNKNSKLKEITKCAFRH